MIISFTMRWHKFCMNITNVIHDEWLTKRESYRKFNIVHIFTVNTLLAHMKPIPFSENTHPNLYAPSTPSTICYIIYMHSDLVVCATKTELIFPYHHHINILHERIFSSNIYMYILTNWIFHSNAHMKFCMWYRNRKFKVQYKVVASVRCVCVVIFVSHPLSFQFAWRIWTFIITSLMNVTSSLCILVSFNYVTNFAKAIHISAISLLISRAELRSMERYRV